MSDIHLKTLQTQYNVENQVKLQILVFNVVCGEGEGRREDSQVKLYSRLTLPKRAKEQICPRLLAIIISLVFIVNKSSKQMSAQTSLEF